MSCKIQCGNNDWTCPCKYADPSKPMPGAEPKPRFRIYIGFFIGYTPWYNNNQKSMCIAESAVHRRIKSGLKSIIQFEKASDMCRRIQK